MSNIAHSLSTLALSTTPRLPPELLPLVFTHLSAKEDLTRCSLVCSRWRDSAQQELFSELILDNWGDPKYSLAADCAVLLGSDRLRRCVRSIGSYLTLAQLAELAKELPNLHKLIVFDMGFWDQATPAHLAPLSNLESLAFIPASDLWGLAQADGNIFGQAIASLPNLRHIHLEGLGIEGDEWMAGVPGPSKLRSAYIKDSALNDAHLQWLIGSSGETFTKLSLFDYMPGTELPPPDFSLTGEGLRRLLGEASQIRTLEIELESLTPPSLSAVLATLPRLEELAIPVTLIGRDSFSHAPATLTQLKLMSAAQGSDEQLTRDALEHLKSCSLARIHEVTLIGADAGDGEWNTLRDSLGAVLGPRSVQFSFGA